MRFYVGLHQPSDAQHFERCMVSINRLRRRKSEFKVGEWMMDSGAFTELKDHGRYRSTPSEYANEARRWIGNGQLAVIVSQDYMCEPFILEKTGLSVEEHQRLTIDRYDELLDLIDGDSYVLPVLQGYWPDEYLAHIEQYGGRLTQGAWVGVGSVCKRNSDVEQIEQVLAPIHAARPDLRLHGFGVKLTALQSSIVRNCLYSADSMAWSFSARKQGRDGNDWREAMAFTRKIDVQEVRQKDFQGMLF